MKAVRSTRVEVREESLECCATFRRNSVTFGVQQGCVCGPDEFVRRALCLLFDSNRVLGVFLSQSVDLALGFDGLTAVLPWATPPFGLAPGALGYFHRRWAPAPASSLIVPQTGGL